MNGFDLALYGTASVAAIVAALAIIPNPFRQGVRDTLSIFLGGWLKSSTTEIQRAELRVSQLEAQLKKDELTASNLRGTLNHAKNQLTAAKAELKKAEDNYQLAVDSKLGKQAEDDCTDAIGAAEEVVSAQTGVVADFQNAADAVRLAIVKAAKELKSLSTLVKSKAAKDVAAKALGSAADILKATKDIAKATSDIGHDLDKIDERYEQAKSRLEDAQGTETERKLEEARNQAKRDEIRKRMEERRKNEGK